MSNQPVNPTNIPHGEAPASWTVKYILDGFDCMLTLRGDSGGDLLPRAAQAIKWLSENGAKPTGNGHTQPQAVQPTQAATPAPAPTLPGGQPDPAWCALHGVAMSRHEKGGQAWYSHKVGDSYCKGK